MCPSALMLHTLVEEGLISEYTFLFIPETTSDLQGSKQVLNMHTEPRQKNTPEGKHIPTKYPEILCLLAAKHSTIFTS